jgi:hypothetical protein
MTEDIIEDIIQEGPLPRGDMYLKFTDEAAANAVLYTEGTPKFANIDTIGVISKPTGEVDADGNPVMAALDGWHVNVRIAGEDHVPLEQYALTPAIPVRVWA